MNLLLLEADEQGPEVVLTGRRADHLRLVLRAERGTTVRCGVIDGALGTALVTAVHPGSVTIEPALDSAPERPRHVLLVAVARPKVLRRVVRDAVCLGFGHLAIFRSWKSERAHLQSHTLNPAVLEPWVREGLEQSRRTWRPQIAIEPLFRPFVDDRLPALVEGAKRFVAHPGPAALGDRSTGTTAIAIGPERGFTDYEVGAFEDVGFQRASLGAHPLRVEAAVAAVAGALLPLR